MNPAVVIVTSSLGYKACCTDSAEVEGKGNTAKTVVLVCTGYSSSAREHDL